MLNDLPGPWKVNSHIGRAAYQPSMQDLLGFCFDLESGILRDPTIASRADTEIAWLLCKYGGHYRKCDPWLSSQLDDRERAEAKELKTDLGPTSGLSLRHSQD